MIYEISIHAAVPWVGEEGDFETEEEAKKYLIKRLEAYKKEMVENVRFSTNIRASDKNFKLKEGAVYLIRRYSKLVPALCLRSNNTWRHTKFEHYFKYLNTGKTFWLVGREPDRLGPKICDKIEFSDKCDGCPGKFSCLTNKH